MEKEWVSHTIERLAEFGWTGKSVSRLAFSKEEQQARDYFGELMKEAGLTVRIDDFGNLIGRLEGLDKNAPAVVTGSHLDTVPEGGKYDGVVGVVGGLAAIKRLKARGPLIHPLELIVFIAEESSRFGYSSMGSKAMTGNANISGWSKARDESGKYFAEVFAQRGFALEKIKTAMRKKQEFKAYVELHIEQGTLLERAGKRIGIVDAIAAPARLRISIEGSSAHSGTTPMDERRDALVSAAMIIMAVQEIAMEARHDGTVGTVGYIQAHPNVMNVIPGQVELGVDIRSSNQQSLIETIQEIKDAISTIADGQETPVNIEVIAAERPVELDDNIAKIIENACHSAHLSSRRMISGAGHDAMYMSKIMPAGLIFIPCKDGNSHNPDEYAAIDDIMNGVEVLTATLYELAR